ncbi:TolC family protein, partial [Klebsiella pneumoniae]|nr:TolC family protein [Klebsiella pneumoniae]
MAQWWHGLGDAQLDALVSQALAHSPTLAEAEGRLRQSRAGLASEQAAGRPKLSANATMLRMRSPDVSQFTGGG